MHQSKELSTSFIENNRDPILLLDLKGTIILAHPCAKPNQPRHTNDHFRAHLNLYLFYRCPAYDQKSDPFHKRLSFNKKNHPRQAAFRDYS